MQCWSRTDQAHRFQYLALQALHCPSLRLQADRSCAVFVSPLQTNRQTRATSFYAYTIDSHIYKTMVEQDYTHQPEPQHFGRALCTSLAEPLPADSCYYFQQIIQTTSRYNFHTAFHQLTDDGAGTLGTAASKFGAGATIPRLIPLLAPFLLFCLSLHPFSPLHHLAQRLARLTKDCLPGPVPA